MSERIKRNEFAVLVPIAETKDGPAYLFEVRSANIRQPGEVCFPGGRMEEGEEPEETAVRETEEEIGIRREDIEVIGRLRPQGMSDGRVITPVVARIRKGALRERSVSDYEVAETFLIPIRWFTENEPRYFELATVPREEIPPLLAVQLANYPDFHRRGTTYYWEYGEHGIWGLTSRILSSMNHSSILGGLGMKTIYLAGGCFWGMQKFIDQFTGVVSTEVGYANGPDEAPSYEEVCRNSGHAETVKIEYDPAKVTLTKLLEMYFMVIDPLSVNRQGMDVGVQYRTGIYYTDEADLPGIRAVFEAEERKAGEPLAVEVEPLRNFFSAEEYHQKYLDKNPTGYCHIPRRFFSVEKGTDDLEV